MVDGKKRGRPKGSKNKTKKKQQRVEDFSKAQDAFEREFSIPRTKEASMAVESLTEGDRTNATNAINATNRTNQDDIQHEEDIHFEFNGGEVEEENDYENYVGVSEQVGFGEVDEFDVMEVVEYSAEGKDDNENETTADIMKELKHGCVSKNSKKIIFLTFCFLLFISTNLIGICYTIVGLLRWIYSQTR